MAARAPRRAKAPWRWSGSSLKAQLALRHLKHPHRYLCSSGFPVLLTQREKGKPNLPDKLGALPVPLGAKHPPTLHEGSAPCTAQKQTLSRITLAHSPGESPGHRRTAATGCDGATRGTLRDTQQAGTAAAQCTQAPSQQLERQPPPARHSPAE